MSGLRFYSEFITLCCTNLDAEKRWWIEVFDCKQVKLPNWDDPLPSDVALKLPGDERPTILLSDRAEAQRAGFERVHPHHIIFCNKLEKAQDYLRSRGVTAGPIEDGGGTQFFEISDPEGNVIEICKEP